MNDIANLAREVALKLEVKKDGLAQRQDGRWQLKVIIHPNDMPPALSLAPMGTRYVAVLVEVGDDEQPVKPKGGEANSPDRTSRQPDTTTPRQSAPSAGGAEHRSWRDMSPAQQAGIRCNEPAFWRFLNETGDVGEFITNADAAASYVRLICGDLQSRSELNTNSRARILWNDLDEKFRAWMQVPV